MRSATRLPLATCVLAFILFSAPTIARRVTAASSVTDCEGDACSQVTLTFDDAKQQYLAQNNSQDRFVRVSASNVAAAAGAGVAPSKSEYLPLKSIVGSYRADYAEAKCLPATGQ